MVTVGIFMRSDSSTKELNANQITALKVPMKPIMLYA